jgi:hypothetical protein
MDCHEFFYITRRGLVWTIILRWQLGKGSVDGGSSGGVRAELLAYVNTKLNFEVRNFTSDWRDGRALVALVESVFSVSLGLAKNHSALHKAETAMEYAKQHALIPIVLAPEDLVSEHVDELSVMTYVSYFQQLERSAPPPPVQSTPVKSTHVKSDAEESLFETVLLRWVKYHQRKANVSPTVSSLSDLWPATSMLPFVQRLTQSRILSTTGITEEAIAWNLAQFLERERLIKTDQAARTFAQSLAAPVQRLGLRELDWMWKLVTLADLKKSSMADPEDTESICAAVRQRLANVIKHSFDPANFVPLCLDIISALSDDWQMRDGDSGAQIVLAISSMVLPVQLLEAADLKRDMDTRTFLLVMSMFADVLEDKTRRIQFSRAGTQSQLSDALKELSQAQGCAQKAHLMFEDPYAKIATLEQALADAKK